MGGGIHLHSKGSGGPDLPERRRSLLEGRLGESSLAHKAQVLAVRKRDGSQSHTVRYSDSRPAPLGPPASPTPLLCELVSKSYRMRRL